MSAAAAENEITVERIEISLNEKRLILTESLSMTDEGRGTLNKTFLLSRVYLERSSGEKKFSVEVLVEQDQS